MCSFPKADLKDESRCKLRSRPSSASPSLPLRPHSRSQTKRRNANSQSGLPASQNRSPGSAGQGRLRGSATPPRPRLAAPPWQLCTHTFSDDFQQLLFLLGQLAFLYVNHCSRQLGGYSDPLEELKSNDVSVLGTPATAGPLETRIRSSQPRKHSNSRLSPAGWRAAGELRRAGQAASAGPSGGHRPPRVIGPVRRRS